MNKKQKKKAFIKLFIESLDEKQIREINRALNRMIENHSPVIDKKLTNERGNQNVSNK